MNRKDFIARLGMGAAFVLTTGCLGSCKKDAIAPQNKDFTLDLTDSAYAALKTNGGYVIVNDVVVARTRDGVYAAATVICSHEQEKRISYTSNNEWECAAHGARFSLGGGGLNSKGGKGLKIYQTTLTGTTLRIFS